MTNNKYSERLPDWGLSSEEVEELIREFSAIDRKDHKLDMRKLIRKFLNEYEIIKIELRKDRGYIKDILRGFVENVSTVEELIDTFSKEWQKRLKE